MLALHKTCCRRQSVCHSSWTGMRRSRDKARPPTSFPSISLAKVPCSCGRVHYRLQTLLLCPHDLEISLSLSAHLHRQRRGDLKCVLWISCLFPSQGCTPVCSIQGGEVQRNWNNAASSQRSSVSLFKNEARCRFYTSWITFLHAVCCHQRW